VSVYVILDWRGVRSVESHGVESVSDHDPLAHWDSPRPSKIYKATNKKQRTSKKSAHFVPILRKT